MYNYDARQISVASRRFNDIQACKVIKIDDGFGLEFELPWGETAQIRPMDFEVGMYQVGDWIDMRLWTVSSRGRISLKTAQFVGKTPDTFVPKE